jgi:outer membrane protein assembly factor BamA
MMRVLLASLCGLAAALFTLAVPARAFAQEGQRIAEIDVVENAKTGDETVKLIADVEVGDTFTFQLVERVRADLVNSGLFKDVQVVGQPTEKGVRLVIVAKDKLSWVIAPTVYLQPGNQGGGIGFGENNLFGSNKKLLMYGQIATADSLFLAGYLDPALGGSPFYFRADTLLRYEEVTEFSGGDFLDEPEPDRVSTMGYYNAGLLLGVNLWRGFALDGRLRAAYVNFSEGSCAESAPMGSTCTESPEADGFDVSTEWKITLDSRANWYGVSRGTLFRLGFEQSLPELGSDYDWWLASGQYIKAVSFFERDNLVLKAGFAIGHQLPFQQELTSGGTNLRGYQNRQFRGDTKASGTLEYSVQLLEINPIAFRGLVFSDLAWTVFTRDEGNPTRNYLPGQTDVDEDPLRIGLGVGFRVYVRSIVLPLLGVDVGYGPQADAYHIYFAVGLTEL